MKFKDSLKKITLGVSTALLLAGCNIRMNAQIRELASETDTITLSSLVLNNNVAQTNTASSIALSSSGLSGTYSHYCLLQNDTTVGNCVWTAGTLPASVNLTGGDGAKVISAWLRTASGTVSSRIDSNSVTLDTVAPELGSVTVGNSSPTTSSTFTLSYGAVTNAPYTSYCILENDTTVGNCSWQAGTLPASYGVSTASEGAKVLSVWIRDAAGNVSARDDAASVVFRTLSVAYALENDITNDLVLTASQNRSGTVYYAAYNANQGTLTAAQVKAAAQAATGGALVKNGTISIVAGSTNYSGNINSMPDKVRYYVYAVGEDSFGLDLDANVKKYSNVLPKKFSHQEYATAIAGKSGITMRYTITVPLGYYNNEPSTWPMYTYMGGGGETFTDAANSEYYFYNTNSRMVDKIPAENRIRGGLDDIPMLQAALQCNNSYFACTNMSEPSMYNEFYIHLKATYRINDKKFYGIGMSWGGSGIWNLINSYPDHFTAAVSVAGYNGYGAGTLCTNFGGSRDTPIWAIINDNDPWFDDANQVTAIANVNACGTYNGDARITVLPTGTYPSNVHGHNTLEYVMNLAYYNFTNSRFERWNGSASVADSAPYTRIDVHPNLLTDLSTASTQLGATSTFTQIWHWLNHFSKP